MSEFKKVVLIDTLKTSEEYFNLPADKQRYAYHTNKFVRKGQEADYLETDDLIYYSECAVSINFNEKLYKRRTGKKGFTFDKNTGKLNMWFKGEVKNFSHLHLFLEYKGFEWVIHEKIITLGLTKTQLQNILNGKITNPTQFCKKFLTANRIKNLSPEVLRKQIKALVHQESGFYKNNILRRFHIYENMDHYYETSRDYQTSSLIIDMEHQALVLGKKINARWSVPRLKQEHGEWSHEMMKLELEGMEDCQYMESALVPKLPKGYEVICTKKRLFQEGTEMHHCIYTNYEHRIRSHTYLAVAYRSEAHRATIGIKVNNKIEMDTGEVKPSLVIEQAYAPWNKELPSELIEQFKKDLLEDQELHMDLYQYFTQWAQKPVEVELDF